MRGSAEGFCRSADGDPSDLAAFRIEFPPGSYTLKARPTRQPLVCPHNVSVEAGAFVHMDLVTQVP